MSSGRSGKSTYKFKDNEQSIYENKNKGPDSFKPMYEILNANLPRKTGGELKSTSEIDITNPDTIYYNLVIQNNTTSYQDAVFEESRSTPLVNKCSEWNLSTVSFTVPGENIPLIYSFKSNFYSVTMSYGTHTVQTFLTIGPYTSNSIGDPDVFSYGQFVLIVNAALKKCYDDLLVLEPTAPNPSAPYFTYNSSNYLMTLSADVSYDIYANLPSAPNSILVYFNQPLFYIFESLQYIYARVGSTTLGKDYQVVITDMKNNKVGSVLNMVEEFPCLENFNDFLSLVFVTNLMPINKEAIPASDGSGKVLGQAIFQDFTPSIALGPEARSTFQYNSDLYRLVNMSTDLPLVNVDVRVFWKDKTQQLRPVRIGPLDFIQLKLMFRKKTLGTG